MAMPSTGTFDYVVVVPNNPQDESVPWSVALREPIESTGDRFHDSRLLGHAPIMQISDAGITPGPPRFKSSLGYPRVMRSKITLTATEKKFATVNSAYFYIDKDLTSALRAGDVMSMTRTMSAGLGISVIRDNQLIVALGAATSVPLGTNVLAQVPRDLIDEAEALFKQRDPEFNFRELPIEICIGGQSYISYGGSTEIDGYEVRVEHGPDWGISGEDECISICLKGACPVVAANLSA